MRGIFPAHPNPTETTKMTDKKTTSVKKLTIADLQPKPTRVTITHPQHEELVAWVEISNREDSFDNQMLIAAAGIHDENANLSIEDWIRLNAKSLSILISNWDEETFGIPFSQEAAETLFLQPYNGWISDALTKHLNERSQAFQKA